MKKPRVLVLTGYGINCDLEAEYGFNLAGGEAERVHINSLIAGEKKLADYQILVFPGGFSFGDDIASGKVLALKSKTRLGDGIRAFVEKGGLVIGICNGFQVLAKFGLLSDRPAVDFEQRVTVTYNDSGRFEDRWVWLKKVSGKCPWLDGIDGIYLPVAHGEGKFFAPPEIIETIENKRQVAFRYVKPDMSAANGEYPQNPNGSLNDIAGICDPSGKILGIMPHPERFLTFYNHPGWTRIKEEYKRRNAPVPEEGDGLKILRNGVNFFS
jgi:phosphoribosylformylglycinamidine synthase subunit PurQ / glutaminase